MRIGGSGRPPTPLNPPFLGRCVFVRYGFATHKKIPISKDFLISISELRKVSGVLRPFQTFKYYKLVNYLHRKAS